MRAPHSGVGLRDTANRKQRFAQPDLKRELLVPAPSALLRSSVLVLPLQNRATIICQSVSSVGLRIEGVDTDDIATLICKIIAGNTAGNIFPI